MIITIRGRQVCQLGDTTITLRGRRVSQLTDRTTTLRGSGRRVSQLTDRTTTFRGRRVSQLTDTTTTLRGRRVSQPQSYIYNVYGLNSRTGQLHSGGREGECLNSRTGQLLPGHAVWLPLLPQPTGQTAWPLTAAGSDPQCQSIQWTDQWRRDTQWQFWQKAVSNRTDVWYCLIGACWVLG